MEELDKVLEAVLFALGREISIKELSENLMLDKEEIISSLENLSKKYNDESGICLVQVNDKYQLVTNKKYYDQVSKFVENTKRQSLSTSALETLSIIAYNPKITKSEIESIRGVNSDFAVNRLLECGLVEEVARLNLPGRPAAYSVTSEFLKSCGIKQTEELPDFDKIAIKDEQLHISDYEKEESVESLENVESVENIEENAKDVEDVQ